MLLVTVLLILSCFYVTPSQEQGGLYLSLNGNNISNESYVDVNTIGDRPGSSALLCLTDLTECCSSSHTVNGDGLGAWFYPDGRKIGYDPAEPSSSPTFHRDRGESVIRLWRHGNPPESGLFCCRVPGSSNTTVEVTVCANVVNITITDQPTYQQVVRRSTALLSIGAHIAMEEQNMLIYQWQRNNQTIYDGSKFEGTETAQLMVKDFVDDDEGVYRCVLNNLIISNEAILTLGVYLQFDGRVYSNDSVIDLDKQDNFRITCYTNNTDCCRSSDTGGNWYFPNGKEILTMSTSEPPTFALNRRSSSSLQIFVFGLGAMERGRFTCKVPNSNDIEESIFIRLLSKPAFTEQPASLVTVNPSNSVTLTAKGFGGDLKYQWFKNGHMITDSDKYQGTVTTDLTVVDVLKSDEGVYHCLVSNDLGNATSRSSLLSQVNEPEIGMSYSLTCTASEAGQLHPSITYQWYKDGAIIQNVSSPVLTFESLSFCDAGSYSCSGSPQKSTLQNRQQFELKFKSIQIQVYLNGDELCSEVTSIVNDVVHALVEILNDRCLCDLTEAHLTMRQLTCDPEGDGLIFSYILYETEQTSTTELVNHLITWINESALINLTTVPGGVVVEKLLSPYCLSEIESTVTVVPSDSASAKRSPMAVEVIMWIALVLLICAVVAVIIMSLVVFVLKKKLIKAKLKKRLPRKQGSEIVTNLNMSYNHIHYDGSNNEGHVNGDGYVSQVYEEIEQSSDEHYVIYSN